jgi:hypothetical protein
MIPVSLVLSKLFFADMAYGCNIQSRNLYDRSSDNFVDEFKTPRYNSASWIIKSLL